MFSRPIRAMTILVAAAAFLVSAAVSSAYAYQEWGGATATPPPSEACDSCHNPWNGGGLTNGTGPHGGYTATSQKCVVCHTVHEAEGRGAGKLMRSLTFSDTCLTCHDGTGGKGVYGTLAARGITPVVTHSFEQTNVVPDGNPSTGGPATRTFAGDQGNITCIDCHSPHGADVVAPFYSDRMRVAGQMPPATSKLLRQRPAGSDTTVTVYGSDWCLSCHRGSNVSHAWHDGPSSAPAIDSRSVEGSSAFYYARVALLATETATSTTVMGGMGRTNRGYLMPYPRSSEQTGHAPICQQCHEDARYVGKLATDGVTAQAAPFQVTMPDGVVATDNPRFQNFPHETQNPKMLVENGDDLCTNCHPASTLP